MKKQDIDPKYYSTLKINNVKEAKELTEEEFKSGKTGLIKIDNITGKLIFKDKKS